MLGSATDDEYSSLVKPPLDADSTCTQSPYIIVEDIDAFYKRIKTAGAKIEMDLREEDYGGKNFSCRDPQGQL